MVIDTAHPIGFQSRTSPRTPGVWRGLVRIAPDFDQPDDTILDASFDEFARWERWD